MFLKAERTLEGHCRHVGRVRDRQRSDDVSGLAGMMWRFGCFPRAGQNQGTKLSRGMSTN